MGYDTHTTPRTDPIDPEAWWRLQDPTDDDSSDVENPKPPLPEYNEVLIEVLEGSRGPTGRIKWKEAHKKFMRKTGWVCLQNQLKDRYHTITLR